MKDIIEGLLLASGDDGISLDSISEILNIDLSEAQLLINRLKEDYSTSSRGIQITQLAGRYMFATLAEHKEYIQKAIKIKPEPDLSRASLETLAIVAYCQPVEKIDVEELRGVKSDRILLNLKRKGLIKESKAFGTYEVSEIFLNYFGLNSTADLPDVD